MKKVVFIALLILFVGLTNCARKHLAICGLRSLDARLNIDSKIIQMERIAIADTTIASISGEIFGKDSSENCVIIDTLIGAVISLVDKETKKVYGSSTDLQGKYKLCLPASIYDVRVFFISYNTLIVRNVSIGTGDIVRFNAMLGQSHVQDDSTVFEMQSDKTFKMIRQPIETNK